VNKICITLNKTKLSAIIILLFAYVLLSAGDSFSQQNTYRKYRILSGLDLCQPTLAPLKNYLIKVGSQDLDNNNCKTTEDIEVDLDEGLARLRGVGGEVKLGNETELKLLFSSWDTSWGKIEKLDTDDPDAKDPSKPWDPSIALPKAIAEQGEFFEFTDRSFSKLIWSPNYYANPYFQAFGGDALGIPIIYDKIGAVGFLFEFGTPYSSVMETDYVKTGIHLLFLQVNVASRIKEMVSKYSSNRRTEDTRSIIIGNWNNMFAPHLGIEFGFEIPLMKLHYYMLLDSLDEYDPPVKVIDTKTGLPMKNNFVRGKGYLNFEVRLPNIKIFNSEWAKIYFGQFFGEQHLGFVARDLTVGKLNMDWRFNYTFPGKRNYQLLFECFFSDVVQGFAKNSFAIGPSIRLGRTPTESFGFITAFVNARFRIGNTFDEGLFK
jgi:hypothetical protein